MTVSEGLPMECGASDRQVGVARFEGGGCKKQRQPDQSA